ncbi:putative isomerase YbhE [Trichodelitschia bisporula]|uniref:Putative isomerase YbhE n=1 Tax=Trichodelitschia bisporula TaxID=703511 RepID=A0A6G1HNJ3_9PEZI|nr:putative isomerase YbhE [Trichodelitschia bisporula]
MRFLLFSFAALAAALPYTTEDCYGEATNETTKYGAAHYNLYVATYAGWVSSQRFPAMTTQGMNLTSNITACGVSPSWLAVDNDNSIIYCVDENQPSANSSSLNALQKKYDGSIVAHSSVKLPFAAPVHATPFGYPKTFHLALAHYTGYVSVVTPGGPAANNLSLYQSFNLTGGPHGPNPARQADGPHPHQTLLDPTGQYIIVPDLGADLLRLFYWNKNATTVKLQELSTTPVFPAGGGPRHGRFWMPPGWKTGDDVYLFLASELSSAITTFRIGYPHGVGLTIQQLSTITDMGNTPIPSNTTYASEIKTSHDGKFLLVSYRGDQSFNTTTGPSDSIATWKIGAKGALEFVQLAPVGGSYPRSFSITGDDKYVAVGLQKSGKVVVLERDTVTGKLGQQKASMDGYGEVSCVTWDA